MTELFAQAMVDMWPSIPWHTPVKVSTTDGHWGWACRICIALHGLKGSDVRCLTQDPDDVVRHIAEEHAR